MTDSTQTLLEQSPHLCPTPTDQAFYAAAAADLPRQRAAATHRLDDFGGLAVEVPAGAAITVRLLEGPQIVNLFGVNPADPDERFWQQSVLREGIFLRRFSRIWGTMARYRPLMTVLEDTVADDPRHGRAQHHPYYGGSGTPLDWRLAGGAPGVPSTWEQFAALLDARGIPRHVLRENVCLFQRSAVDTDRMQIDVVPSNAVAGDRVTLLAEIDLLVLLALSPYVDGGRPASTPGAPVPSPIAVEVSAPFVEPLPWPYPGVGYPDLSLYLDESGTRSTSVGGTAGIDYEVTRDA